MESLLTEKNGSSTRALYYHKDSHLAVSYVVESNKQWNLIDGVKDWFSNTFLPRGYPYTVSRDYLCYQIWDTLQAFCSTITGILATQEVFRSVGVGDNTATPLAATITWVMRDGCGHFGRILFATKCGRHMDINSKRWRLYADIINDVAMCLELTLSTVQGLTTAVLCCSTILRAIVGVAGTATRMAMTHHHAKLSNFADVSAKDSAQETAVNLIASLAALLILNINTNTVSLNLVFLVFVILHVIFNYKACRVTCLRQFNETRLLAFLDLLSYNNICGTPEKINEMEPILYNSYYTAELMCSYKIVLGCSLEGIINRTNTIVLKELQEVYKEEEFIIIPDMDRRCIFVLFKEKAGNFNIIEGYIQAYFLSTKLRKYRSQKELTGSLLKEIKKNSFFMKNYAGTSLLMLKNEMMDRGWDLANHLLVVDNWRVIDENYSI